jgi:hypothetical protein
MEPIVAIATTLTALRTSLDLTKGAIDARDKAKLAELTQVMNERILDVQNAALDLQGKMFAATSEISSLEDRERQLKAENAQLTAQAAERDKYRLHELSEGVFVLAYKSEAPDGTATEPAHYLCQPCMDNEAKKVVLQRKSGPVNVALVCNHCSATYFAADATRDAHRAFSEAGNSMNGPR